MDMRISSDVPLGAGLSSSASLLVALLRAISRLSRVPLEDHDIARLAHLAETEFVGAPVGIMDQMVCALGKPGSAFFLDVADRQYEHVPLPQAIEWLVIHSGVHHSHATGSYQSRRRECDRASALLGVHWLRDLQGVDPSNLEPNIEALPSPLARRVRHVISENARVLAVKRRLLEGDLSGIGAEMNASHESLRRDFEVSVPETDLLVELAQADPAVYGARLTGGGFGGSVVIAAQAGTGPRVAHDIVQAYRLRSKRKGTVLLPPSLG
jgi:galactokinase